MSPLKSITELSVDSGLLAAQPSTADAKPPSTSPLESPTSSLTAKAKVAVDSSQGISLDPFEALQKTVDEKRKYRDELFVKGKLPYSQYNSIGKSFENIKTILWNKSPEALILLKQELNIIDQHLPKQNSPRKVEQSQNSLSFTSGSGLASRLWDLPQLATPPQSALKLVPVESEISPLQQRINVFKQGFKAQYQSTVGIADGRVQVTNNLFESLPSEIISKIFSKVHKGSANIAVRLTLVCHAWLTEVVQEAKVVGKSEKGENKPTMALLNTLSVTSKTQLDNLSKVLKTFPGIQHLTLHAPEMCTRDLICLTGNTQLKSLSINAEKSRFDHNLFSILQTIGDLEELSLLNLTDCLKANFEDFYKLNHLTSLYTLNLHGCKDMFSGIERFFQNHSDEENFLNSLKKIDLSDNFINDQELTALIKKMDSISSINLSLNARLKARFLLDLAEKNIIDLDLSFNQFSVENINKLNNLKKLITLNLEQGFSGKSLSDQTILQIAKIDTLEILNLARNIDISDEAFKTLGGLTKLRELKINGCSKLTENGLSILENFTQIEKLNLGCTAVTDRIISLVWQHCPKLQHLSLVGCDHLMGNWELPASEAPQLLSLDLENSLTNCEFSGLLDLLKHQAKLQFLNLTGHKLRDDQIVALLNVLPCLQTLVLDTASQIEGLWLKPDNVKWPQLKVLNLAFCHSLQPAGLLALQQFPNLETLVLEGCDALSYHEETLENLKHLKSLKTLECGDGLMRRASVEALRAVLPNTNISGRFRK